MSTIQKRNSENQVPANADNLGAPELKKSKSSGSGTNDAPQKQGPVGRTSDFLAAWGAGRFNSEDVDAVQAALSEFFTADTILDASSAAHSGVPEYKVHHGFAGLKDWFNFLASFDMEGIEMSHVEGPTPNEIWMTFSTTKGTCKATGKSAPFHGFNIFTWEGDKMTKVTIIPYNPAVIAAICSEEDAPIPPPVQLPAFEPHPNPSEPFGEKMALWGAGEFSKREVRSEHVAADCVDDMTDSALPDVLKAYRGIDGTGESLDYASATWDLSNLDTALVVGLKPGCVMLRFTFDVKHKITGKEAKGVQKYTEFAYNAEGKFVYGRHYWANATLFASIY